MTRPVVPYAPFERGNWKVLRDCCASGTCSECASIGKPIRVTQVEGVSQRFAEWVASNWSQMNARAVHQ